MVWSDTAIFLAIFFFFFFILWYDIIIVVCIVWYCILSFCTLLLISHLQNTFLCFTLATTIEGMNKENKKINLYQAGKNMIILREPEKEKKVPFIVTLLFHI